MSAWPAKADGATLFASAVLFWLPTLALTTTFGMSLVQLVILLTAAWLINKGLYSFYRDNFRTMRWVMAGFAGFFFVSLLRKLYFGTGISSIDGPSRLLFALSCIGFVGILKPRMKWFWLGLCAGAIGAAVVAATERFGYGLIRVEGFTHHAITFGDLALAMGLMALCAMGEFAGTRLAWLPLAALLSGLIVSILSGSRGGWVALLLSAIPLLSFRRQIHARGMAVAVACIVSLAGAAYLIPATGVAERIGRAVSEVGWYFLNGDASTSVGIRFDLWKASWMMFVEHPWLGVGRGEFFSQLQRMAQDGKVALTLDAVMNQSSTNDVLHFLSTGGLVDFVFLLLMYFAPLFFFLAVLKQTGNPHKPAALAGIVLVFSFIGFGLTDSMFWLMRPKIFYSMMLCVLIGFCLSPRETHA